MRLDGHPFVWKLRTYGTIEIAAALYEEVSHTQKHKSTNPRRQRTTDSLGAIIQGRGVGCTGVVIGTR